MNINSFEGFIFDLDGTLIDSNGVWKKINRQILEKKRIRLSEEELTRSSRLTYEEAAEFFRSKGADYTTEELRAEMNRLAVKEYRYNIFLKNGVKDFLERVRAAGGKTAVATASPRELYEPVLRNNCVYGMFDAVVTTEEAGAEKDFPDVYLAAAERIGVFPDRCAVFEDVLKGIVSAKNAGMYAVAVYDRSSEADVVTMRAIADEFIMGFDFI